MPRSDSVAVGLPGAALRLVPPVDARRQVALVVEREARDAARGRICAHWPMDAPEGIRAASEALRGLVDLWVQAERLNPAAGPLRVAGQPDDEPADGIDIDLLLLKAAEVPDAARATARAMADLAQQFLIVAQWLTRSAQASCRSVQPAPCPQQFLAAPRDDHRSIARDFLCADMNAGIARLLLRAAQALNSVVLPVQVIRNDLLDTRSLREPLQAAATMLERARTLAAECAAFVESFDHQWADLRGRIASAMAPPDIAATAAVSRPA